MKQIINEEFFEQLDKTNNDLEKLKKDIDKSSNKISSYVGLGVLGIYLYITVKEIYKEIKKLTSS